MRVIRSINSGGFGVVEQVELNGTHYARKTFRPSAVGLSTAEIEKMRLRFLREVRVQSSLDIDGVVPVLHADLSSVEPYYLMPLADQTLDDAIVTARVRARRWKNRLLTF